MKFTSAKLLKAILFLIVSFHLNQSFGKNISFSENKGQWHADALYRAELPGGAIFLTKNGPVYNFSDVAKFNEIHEKQEKDPHWDPSDEVIKMHSYRLRFVNPNPNTTCQTPTPNSFYENYFIGNDPSKWASKVRTFDEVIQKNIFEKTDLVYYTKDQQLKYDFIVRKGGDAHKIQMMLQGATASINDKQKLEIKTSINTVIEDVPFAYQNINNKILPIECKYHLENNIISFEVGEYNKNYPLIIDPGLIFATYSGGTTSSLFSYTTTFDYANNTITGAEALGVGWPVTIGAYDVTFNGAHDVAIMKMTGNGSTKLFATYIGGTQHELPNSISCSNDNTIYIIGFTRSPDFPVSTNGYQTTYNWGYGDIFVAKLSSDGAQLLASTYLGGNGSDGFNVYNNFTTVNTSPSRIKFNNNDNTVWITSTSSSNNFPTTANAMQSTTSNTGALLAQFNNNLSQLMYSSFTTANNDLFFHDFKISNTNQIYLCGHTEATNIGTTNAFHPAFLGGTSDAFIMKFNANSKSVLACSYIGTAGKEDGKNLAIANSNNGGHTIYISGLTDGVYPVTPGTYNSNIASKNYIQVLDSTLSTGIRAATIGNNTLLHTSDIYANSCKAFGIAGMKNNNSPMPTTPNAYATTGEFWFGVLNYNLDSLVYATNYGYGGHVHTGTYDFDPNGNIHHSVCDNTGNFVTTPGVLSPSKQTPFFDVVTFKFDIASSDSLVSFNLSNNSNDSGCAPYTIHFINNSYNFDSYLWDFGNGTTSTDFNPTAVTYTQPGLYKVKLVATNSICNYLGTDSMFIYIKSGTRVYPFVSDTTICSNVESIILKIDSLGPANVLPHCNITWNPTNAIVPNANPTTAIAHPKQIPNGLVNINFQSINNDTVCIADNTVSIHINFHDTSLVALTPTVSTICSGDSVILNASGGYSYVWSPTEYLQSNFGASNVSKPLQDITYTVTITDTNQCVYEKTSKITVNALVAVDAGPEIVLNRGGSGNLKGKTNATNFHWEKDNVVMFQNQLQPAVTSNDEGKYFLVVTNGNGCINKDSTYVHLEDIVMPNAFSPNGDGLNDVFYPTSHSGKGVLINFSVYNRFGQLVYYTNRLGKGWDGTFNNRTCEAGVYFYKIIYSIGDTNYEDKGDVTLIR